MNEKGVTLLWKRYQDCLAYIKSKKLDKIWDECTDFIEGRQWPSATKKTQSLPRPVVNVCSMIAENRKSNILSSKLKMLYKPAEVFFDLTKAQEGADLFTKFAENIAKEIHQDDLDDEAQTNACNLGTYIYHYYWDTQVIGGMQSPYIGGMRGEILHPENVFLANPLIKDIQKQPWIIITSCEPFESVRDTAKKNGIRDWMNIKPDYEILDEDLQDKEYCTVLTQYSRKNGKVVWQKATQNVYLQEPIYWEPGLNKVSGEDLGETKEPDFPKKDKAFRNQLYPLVMEAHRNRKNCAYGIGEVEQAIPNNRAINFNLGMMLLSVQQTAWPKIIQKVGALAKQSISNSPGEILTDYSKSSNWGVSYLNTGNFNPQALTLTSTILDLTRTTTGSTEVVTGEVLGANMAASAIIALQNQAKKPVEIFQKKFYRAYEKIGAIWLQFFKYYYNDGRMFAYEEDNETLIATMNGNEYENFDYSMAIEVGPGGAWSESLTINLIDTMHKNGEIDTDEYIELYPDGIMTFKQKLKQMREKKLQDLAQKQTVTQPVEQPNLMNDGLNQMV